MDSSPGAKLIERLQRTLGIAILVQSIEPAEVATDGADASGEGDDVRGADPLGGAVTIRATFLFGSNTTDVAVSGDTETNAWDALARAAIAWRNADYQHIPMWGGGG